MKILELGQTSVTVEDMVELFQNSFEERLRQGLHYTLSDIDEVTYKSEYSKSKVFVAIDEFGNLIGTAGLSIEGDGAYLDFWCVSESVKHKGIGSSLCSKVFAYVKARGAKYIWSDTSVNAESAVNAHLKQGFKIVGMESYVSTNYYSYIFRFQFDNDVLWSNNMFCRFHFFLSAIKIHILKKENGSLTWAGCIHKRVSNLKVVYLNLRNR